MALPVATGAVSGVAFGAALEKGDVHRPANIHRQMSMKQFTMMKMFLSAAGTGAAVIGLLNLTDDSRMTGLKLLQPWANGLGGFLLGVGMSISGACPGTVFAQLGSGVRTAPYVFGGGILGTAAFAYLKPHISSSFLFTSGAPGSAVLLHKALGVSYWQLAFGVAGLIGAGLYLLEKYLAPTRQETPAVEGSLLFNTNLYAKQWSPYWAGMLIGLLQLPNFLLAVQALSTSSFFVTVTAALLSPFHHLLGYSNSYLSKFLSGSKVYWQSALVPCISLGAYLSSEMSGTRARNAAEPVSQRSKVLAAVGGALLLFGARLADGCTSGHGLSGMSQLSLSSLIAVPAMFAGGMLTAFFFPELTCAKVDDKPKSS